MGWVAPAASLVTGYLGNKASKKAQNQADEAMRQQGALAQQSMQPYNEYFNYNGGAPQAGQSPWELAIARSYTDALQGYDPNTSSLQNSALLEAIDNSYSATEAAQKERLTQAGFDPSSGTFLRSMNDLDEQRALGRQSAARDLYFQNEELKRQQAGNLANMGQSVFNLPLAASGVYGSQGAAAQNRSDQIMGNYTGLAGTLGTMYGMMGKGGGGGAETPSTGGQFTGSFPTTAPTTGRPWIATTSTNQPANFGSMTSWQSNPASKYRNQGLYGLQNQSRYFGMGE